MGTSFSRSTRTQRDLPDRLPEDPKLRTWSLYNAFPLLDEHRISSLTDDPRLAHVTREQLLELLVLPSTRNEYRSVFFLTYRAHFTPTELLRRLIEFYENPILRSDAEDLKFDTYSRQGSRRHSISAPIPSATVHGYQTSSKATNNSLRVPKALPRSQVTSGPKHVRSQTAHTPRITSTRSLPPSPLYRPNASPVGVGVPRAHSRSRSHIPLAFDPRAPRLPDRTAMSPLLSPSASRASVSVHSTERESKVPENKDRTRSANSSSATGGTSSSSKAAEHRSDASSNLKETKHNPNEAPHPRSDKPLRPIAELSRDAAAAIAASRSRRMRYRSNQRRRKSASGDRRASAREKTGRWRSGHRKATTASAPSRTHSALFEDDADGNADVRLANCASQTCFPFASSVFRNVVSAPSTPIMGTGRSSSKKDLFGDADEIDAKTHYFEQCAQLMTGEIGGIAIAGSTVPLFSSPAVPSYAFAADAEVKNDNGRWESSSETPIKYPRRITDELGKPTAARVSPRLPPLPHNRIRPTDDADSHRSLSFQQAHERPANEVGLKRPISTHHFQEQPSTAGDSPRSVNMLQSDELHAYDGDSPHLVSAVQHAERSTDVCDSHRPVVSMSANGNDSSLSTSAQQPEERSASIDDSSPLVLPVSAQQAEAQSTNIDDSSRPVLPVSLPSNEEGPTDVGDSSRPVSPVSSPLRVSAQQPEERHADGGDSPRLQCPEESVLTEDRPACEDRPTGDSPIDLPRIVIPAVAAPRTKSKEDELDPLTRILLERSRIKVAAALRTWLRDYFDDFTAAMRRDLRLYLVDKIHEFKERRKSSIVLDESAISPAATPTSSASTPTTSTPTGSRKARNRRSRRRKERRRHKRALREQQLRRQQLEKQAKNQSPDDSTPSARPGKSNSAIIKSKTGGGALRPVLLMLNSKEKEKSATSPAKNGVPLEPNEKLSWSLTPTDFPDRALVERYGGGVDLLECSPYSVAHQLTLIDFQIFKRIRLTELTNRSWTRKPKGSSTLRSKLQARALKSTASSPTENPEALYGDEHRARSPQRNSRKFATKAARNKTPSSRSGGVEVPAPNVVYFIEEFNRVSFWTASEILMRGSTDDRCRVACFMLEVANYCLAIQNLHTAMAITAGIRHSSVFRLKDLRWVTDTGKYGVICDRLDELISAKSGYKHYRALLEKCLNSGQPTLPFMSVMLKDLFVVQQATPREVETSTINIRRLAVQTELIGKLRSCQLRDFSKILVEEPQLQLALREEIARTLSEDELRMRSLLLEPRMTLEEQKQAAMVEALLKEGFL